VSLLNSCLKMLGEWIYMTCWLKRIFEKVSQDGQPLLFVLGTPTNGNHLASFPLGIRHGVLCHVLHFLRWFS
jgi:hypothetical protein